MTTFTKYVCIILIGFALGWVGGAAHMNGRWNAAVIWTMQNWCPQMGNDREDDNSRYCRNAAWRVFYVADLFEAPDAPLHRLKRTP